MARTNNQMKVIEALQAIAGYEDYQFTDTTTGDVRIVVGEVEYYLNREGIVIDQS